MDRDGTVALLEAILADLPRLDGAACVGLHEVFDDLPGRGHSRDQLQGLHGVPGTGAVPESLR